MILSKTDGTVIQSTGLLEAADTSIQEADQPGVANRASTDDAPSKGAASVGQGHTAEDVARMVFAFVSAAKQFTDGLYSADEVKLLRMRMTRNEIVIVPGRSLHACSS